MTLINLNIHKKANDKRATRNGVVTHHRPQESNRKIAQLLGMSPKTVNKIVCEHEAALQQGEEALESFMQSKPKYATSLPKKVYSPQRSVKYLTDTLIRIPKTLKCISVSRTWTPNKCTSRSFKELLRLDNVARYLRNLK